MPYLVDGHNLIPSSGIRLDSPDDELELIVLLQAFARVQRRDVEVYFDGAPPGSAGSRRFGRVRAHFVRDSSTADAAIKSRLEGLGGAARNWIVVSSDRQVQAAARHVHARSLSSGDFAGLLRKARAELGRGEESERQEGRTADTEDIEHWLRVFRGEK